MLGIVRRITIRVLAVSILGTAPFVLSQSNNASIDGEITDPKGTVVQGANVVLTAKDTNESSTAGIGFFPVNEAPELTVPLAVAASTGTALG